MKKWICRLGLISVLILIAVVFLLSSIIYQKKNTKDIQLYKIRIPFNSTAADIAKILKREGICWEFNFRLIAKLISAEKKLKAGVYLLSPSFTMETILKKIADGETIIEKITIPEGFTVKEIAQRLSQEFIIEEKEFLNFLDNLLPSKNYQKHPFLLHAHENSLEGFLFPDTYNFTSGVKAEIIVETMLKRFEEKVVPLFKGQVARVKAQGSKALSFYETLILASVVEKEAKKAQERPLIASVFLNRLKTNMPLAADPTLKYILDSPPEILNFEDLKIKSPYNTYLYAGLPPTPICSPGVDSIKAVLTPEKTSYYYFVAKGDGFHYFTENLEEHLRKQFGEKKIRKITF